MLGRKEHGTNTLSKGKLSGCSCPFLPVSEILNVTTLAGSMRAKNGRSPNLRSSASSIVFSSQ
jgi:hypothetical protein